MLEVVLIVNAKREARWVPVGIEHPSPDVEDRWDSVGWQGLGAASFGMKRACTYAALDSSYCKQSVSYRQNVPAELGMLRLEFARGSKQTCPRLSYLIKGLRRHAPPSRQAEFDPREANLSQPQYEGTLHQ